MSEEIKKLRKEIDEQDAIIVRALGKRFEATREVGEIKAENDLPARDPKREEEQRERIAELAVDAGIPNELIQEILGLILTEVIFEHVGIRERHDEAQIAAQHSVHFRLESS